MPSATLNDRALAARLDGFAAAYGAMARFLLAPADDDLRRRLGEPGQLESWPIPRDPETSRGIDLLTASSAVGETAAALQQDYERLFIGPNSLLAPPYESVYRTVERLVFDAPTFEVRAEYRSLGVQAPSFNREPDDHLGLEFSFLTLLCSRALDALERRDQTAVDDALEAQRRFLREHLLRWAADCLGLVEANAETAFYRGIGALGLGVLAHAASW
jgi:TorA maturation chaperone TorD